MFLPAPYRVVGFVPDNAKKSDPVNDPALIAEASQHFWVELGGGFTAADPAFRSAELGQTFTAASGQFAEVPDNLRHKVAVRLQAETGGNAFSVDLQKQKVLDYTFSSAELVGKPLSIGHFVNSTPGAVLIHTYSPYLLVGQNDGDISDDPIIRGQDYQEFISGLFGALVNQVVTGVSLEMDVIQPGGQKETFERALVDRVGFAARNSSAGADLNLDLSSGQAAILSGDITTLLIESSLLNGADFSIQATEMDQLGSEVKALQKQPSGIGDSKLEEKGKQYVILLTRELGINLVNISVALNQRNHKVNLIRSYQSVPRIVLVSNRLFQNNDTFFQRLKIDLVNNTIRAIAFPGQSKDALLSFHMYRGLVEAAAEHFILSTSINNQIPDEQISIIKVFQEALSQGISIILLSKQNFDTLQDINLSENAKLRIAQSLSQGKIILRSCEKTQLPKPPLKRPLVIMLALYKFFAA